MKKANKLIVILPVIFLLSACDKKFQEINTNPQQIRNTNPGYLFSNALLTTPASGWTTESTIIQQFVLPYNQGVTLGYQFNEDVDGSNNGPFNVYTGSLKYLEHIIPQLKADATRANFYNQVRIWRAYCYMWLVDHYGDVPYSEAGKGALEGSFFPKYEKDEVIYDDLRKELKEASDALNASGDNNARFDIFVAPGTSTAAEVTYWKRLGYSLLLRLGMRYSKIDANKAKAIVQEAFNGGVMQSNNDNVYIKYRDAAGAAIVGYSNTNASGIRTTSYFYYLAEPFVNTLKAFTDPRLKYISARYTPFQSTVANVANPDTTTVNQFGFPIGYSDATISTAPGYRPPTGTGQDYSQVNAIVMASPLTPQMVITHAQTQLLLAEAAFKGWLPAGALTAQQYYEAGVRASMDSYTLFPGTAPIPLSLQNQYLAINGVAYNATDALKLINTQYWIECFTNSYEGWCNFRRTGLPALLPNKWNDNLKVNGVYDFIRRFSYPLRERSANPDNYTAAVASLGGPDKLTTRIFWDSQ